MVDFAKIKELADKAAATSKNMNEAQSGGGKDYEPPAAGPTRLRFIGYIELGKQADAFKGVPRVRDMAMLTFELSGPKHKPVEMDDGTKVPHRINITLPLSLNEKANFYKLFRALNHAGKATHIAQLIGEAYKGVVVHRSFKGRDGKDHIDAGLYDKERGTFTIGAPVYEVVNGPDHEEPGPTGDFQRLAVDAPISPLRLFLWDYADKEQWDGLFIDGSYPERKNDKGEVTAPARSKNVFQNKIMLAKNFKSSPIHTLLAGAGVELDLPEAETVADEDGVPDNEDDPTKADPALASLNSVGKQPKLGM